MALVPGIVWLAAAALSGCTSSSTTPQPTASPVATPPPPRPVPVLLEDHVPIGLIESKKSRSARCVSALDRFSDAWDRALPCQSDSDCERYAGSCVAVGKNKDRSDAVDAAFQKLGPACGTIAVERCTKAITPVCASGVCRMRIDRAAASPAAP